MQVVLLLGQSVYPAVTLPIQVELLGEPIDLVGIELDLCQGMVLLVSALLQLVPGALVVGEPYLLSNHSHATILLAYQIAHPARRVLKTRMKGDMVSGEPVDNDAKVFGIVGVMLDGVSVSRWRARFGCGDTKRDSGCFP